MATSFCVLLWSLYVYSFLLYVLEEKSLKRVYYILICSQSICAFMHATLIIPDAAVYVLM